VVLILDAEVVDDRVPVVTDSFDERVVELGRLVVFSKIFYKSSSLL
jgi:hypothetical protein